MVNIFQSMYRNSWAFFFGELIDLAFAFADSVFMYVGKNYDLPMSIVSHDELILWEQMLENPILPTYSVTYRFLA